MRKTFLVSMLTDDVLSWQNLYVITGMMCWLFIVGVVILVLIVSVHYFLIRYGFIQGDNFLFEVKNRRLKK